MYFGRIWEITGIYVILFRQFIESIWKFIFLIVVFVVIAADFFYVVGCTNSLVNPLTDEYFDPPFQSIYESMLASIYWGLLAQDSLKKIDQSDSKTLLVILFFLLSMVIALILLNLLIAVIGWLF